MTIRLDSLPHELLLHIFTFLPAEEIELHARICKLWNRLACEPFLWTQLVLKKIGETNFEDWKRRKRNDYSWRRVYFLIADFQRKWNQDPGRSFRNFFIGAKSLKHSVYSNLLTEELITSTLLNRIRCAERFGLNSQPAYQEEHCKAFATYWLAKRSNFSFLPILNVLLAEGETNYFHLLIRAGIICAKDLPIVAAEKCNVKALEILQEIGVSIFACENRAYTPVDSLIRSIEQGSQETEEQLETLTFFIKVGAPLTKESIFHTTPLHLASQRSTKFIEILIANGVPPDIKNGESRTPLHFAAASGFTKGVTLLVEKGANINASSCLGQTALHEALIQEKESTALELIKLGADVTCLDKADQSALDYARIHNLSNAEKAIISKSKSLKEGCLSNVRARRIRLDKSTNTKKK